MTGPVLVAIALIIAFAAATQSITGFGFALIVVPGLGHDIMFTQPVFAEAARLLTTP